MLHFSRSEYQDRLDKTKKRMDRAGLQVLLLSDPANINYLSGYDSWSFYVHQMLVVALEAAEPIWVGRGMDANAARLTTYLQPDSIRPYPDDYVQSPLKHPMEFVAGLLEAEGWAARSIGVEMDAYYFTARCLTELTQALPRARFQDADLLVNWVRIIKSPAEIEYMQQAARIIEKVMARAIETIAPGVRECDAVARIYEAQISGTPDFGGDYTAIVPLLPSGPRTSTPHLTWSDEPYQSDQAVIMELAAARHHYHCPMARTLYLGRPPAKLQDTAEVVVEGLNSALEAVRPGTTCQEVEAAWRRNVSKSGLVKESRLGYSMGLNYPPDWGEHTASLRPGDLTVLEENMTFHLIPGIWMDDWGIEISEAFRVTASGGQTLADFPRKLFVK